MPSTATWLPGQPPAVVEQAADQASLTAASPSPLTPVAAFVGRRSISVYRFPLPPDTAVPATASTLGPATQPVAAQATSAQVTLTTERGVLRSVTAERPIARILLSGDELAVRSAALMIAAAAPVSVPRASLAARAIAMAANGAPEPRHLGAPGTAGRRRQRDRCIGAHPGTSDGCHSSLRAHGHAAGRQGARSQATGARRADRRWAHRARAGEEPDGGGTPDAGGGAPSPLGRFDFP